jgi:subtilisin family serine protease
LSKRKLILLLMKAYLALAMLLSISCTHRAEAKKCGKPPIRIVVVDTGFGYMDHGHDAKLCNYGHKDFSMEKQATRNYATKDAIPLDTHGHGTNIVGVIDGYLKQTHVNYCFVIVKYYSERQTGSQNLLATIRAFNYASNIHAEFINYSGGGPEQNPFERAAIKRFLDHGGKMIAAAGNEGEDLDQPENAYYPALYDKRIIVVGNLGKNGVRYNSSNYGSAVTRWEVGQDVKAYDITMTGTSQATAVATGKIASESDNKCDIGF